MKKILLITLIITSLFSCRKTESLGFYQPIMMRLAVPDGPPEFKAGWHAGCRSGMLYKVFANSWVYQEGEFVDFGSGIYTSSPIFRDAWRDAYYACRLNIEGSIDKDFFFRSSPLQ